MINKIILQGRLTKDIELKTIGDGIATTEFTVAWSEKYKEKETKLFLRCKAWRQTAEFLNNYFHKGQELVIEGHMSTEEWEADGEKKSRTICNIDKVHFCGSKQDNAGNNDGGGVPYDAVDDENLPFN